MMKKNNSDMQTKIMAAFQKAGIELPAITKDKPIAKGSKSNTGSNKKAKSKKRKKDHSNPSKKVARKCRGLRSRKKSKNRMKLAASSFDDSLPPLLGGSYQQKSSIESEFPERTVLNTKKGVRFKPNMIFHQNRDILQSTSIDEQPCKTQISQGSEIEVQLVIGLDLGTSMTKVIIGDPDQKRFYAVPLSPLSENPYLIPTSIVKDQRDCIIIDTEDSLSALSNIKLDLMENMSNEAMVHLAGYIAQIVRRSISWFCLEHADDYRGMQLFWTMAMGLPVDSVRQPELESRFRIAAISGAQAAISQDSIAIAKLSMFVKVVEEDLVNLDINGPETRSCFEELGGDKGVVTVVPEIAAQVVGLCRSRRWDGKKPISFMIDVGASTVDSAVFSIVDTSEEDKELAFCAFSCDVSELGVVNLHQDRVDWLLQNLPEYLSEREEVVAFLKDVKRLKGRVPGKIDDYINHVEINRGKINPDPDEQYKDQLWDKVYRGVLHGAKRKSERDSAWYGLRTMICGGGARSAFYENYISGISKNSGFDLQVEELEKPKNLDAPGLPTTEYDRLSVAYGLAQGTQWEYRWPESLEEISYTNKDPIEGLVSKDMV